jgi:hypothetical protein
VIVVITVKLSRLVEHLDHEGKDMLPVQRL